MTLILLWNLPPVGRERQPVAVPVAPRPVSRLGYRWPDVPEEPDAALPPVWMMLAMEFLND